MKLRLYAGSINSRPDEKGWRNYVLDVSPRPVWDRDLNMGVLPHFVADVANLVEFRDETFHEVVLNHVLEHLPLDRAHLALGEVSRVLVHGGQLDIEVPDVGRICKAWVHGELDHAGLVQWLYGEQLPQHEPGDSHRYGWTEPLLREALEAAGFEVGERKETALALRFVAVKA